MSLLIITAGSGHAAAENAAARALAAAQAQGFANPRTLRWSEGSAWWYPTPQQPGSIAGACVDDGDRFAASVGTFFWRGQGAEASLRRLLEHDGPAATLPFDEFSGSFLVLLGRDDGVWLFGDALGLVKAYEAEGTGVVSSSFLVCRAALERTEVDRLRAQEYVLLGATHGRDTPVRGLRAVDPAGLLDLRRGTSSPVHRPQRLLEGERPATFEAAVQSTADAIAGEFRDMLGAHGPRIGMALSGGFDSRLLLAALDHVGVKPTLYVYGPPGSDDVQVAVHVARGIGLPIEAIDKSVLERGKPALDRAGLLANLRFFDGLPVDGVFDRGADRDTRLAQVQQGLLNLNGGGGEILRNFFYLPDRPYSASDVQGAFYAGWLDEVFPRREDRDAFRALVPDEILTALGRPAGNDRARRQPLPRAEVELIYSLFRLRWWMGRNNGVAARYGAFMTPLVTPRLVRHAAALPLRFKDYGRLEAAVIAALSPRVAAGPSTYGFSFADGPSMRQRLNVQMTMRRPVFVRHYSLRVQKALGRVRVPSAPREWCDALGAAPCADWLDPQALTSLAQVNRLMTLQALLSLAP